MGMFDRLTCLYKLPLPEDPKGFTGVTEFQTKSLNNFLDHYKIDQEGMLWLSTRKSDFNVVKNIDGDNFFIEKHDWIFCDNITNTIEIHNSIHNENKDYDYWINYELVVIKGKVDGVKIISFEATSNAERKVRVNNLIKSFEKRDQFENTFLYKNLFKYYNNFITSLFTSIRHLVDYLSKMLWKLENKLRI